jgi:hypothetical protein
MSEFFIHWLQLPTREMFMMSEFLVHRFQQHLVIHLSNCQTCFIHNRDNSFMRRFNQIANDLIVEVVDVRPFNSFALIFLLFLLQHEFDEKLLQFLVAIIDAEERKKSSQCQLKSISERTHQNCSKLLISKISNP